MAARRAPGSPDPSYFGSGNFDADDFDDGPSVPLVAHDDTQASHGAGAAGSTDLADDVDDFQKGSTGFAPAPQLSPAARRRQWPTGVSPDADGIRIDAIEIALEADYGDKPTGLVSAPAYAFRVTRRKRVLEAKREELRASLVDAEYERDSLVATMVRDLRGKILLTEQGERLFEPVVAIEKTALERRSALAGTSAEYDRRAKELDDQRVAIEGASTQQRGVAEQRRAALSEQRMNFDRADAKMKRLFIEVRAIVEAAEKNPETMTSAQGKRLAALEAEIAQQRPELDALTRAVEAAQAAVTASEGDARQVRRMAREMERTRQALDQEFQKEIGARTQGVSQVDRQRLQAIVAVGCAVLASRGKMVEVADDTLDAISRAEKVVLDRTTSLEKTRRAVSSYDKDAFKQGVAVAAGAVAAVLALILFFALHSGAPPPAP
jgi:hypothetical protein